jgi:uncharacterized repeat protein (TIGR01451 family)
VTYASLASGATASATFTVETPIVVTDGAVYGASASVQADQADPKPSNDLASASVTLSNRADLGITGTVDRRAAKSGDLVRFTFDVVNGGPGAAGSVVVTDQVPAGLQLVSASSTVGGCGGTTLVSCSLGTMAGGASAMITVHARVTAGGGTRVVNAATVASPNHDPVAGNNSTSVALDVKGKPSR